MSEQYQKLSKEEIVEIVSEKDFLILKLKEELAQMKKLIFGSKSERFVPAVNPEQVRIDFDLPTDKPNFVEKTQKISYTRKVGNKKEVVHTGRMVIPAHIPRVEIIIEPKQDVAGLKCIGQEEMEELELEPARFIVNKYIRPKYAKEDGEGVIIGELPSRPIEKGIPGPGFLTTIINQYRPV